IIQSSLGIFMRNVMISTSTESLSHSNANMELVLSVAKKLYMNAMCRLPGRDHRKTQNHIPKGRVYTVPQTHILMSGDVVSSNIDRDS
ncbi:2865_t:CDS:2, partial [Racocetra persica]